MRFRRRMELEHGLRQIDIVPLINVLFLLVIFILLTSEFTVRSGIDVRLPAAVTSEAVQKENIELIVSGDDQVYLNGRAVSLPELKRFLQQVGRRKPSVLIKADTRVPLGRVVEIWDMCRQAGVAQANIATNQE